MSAPALALPDGWGVSYVLEFIGLLSDVRYISSQYWLPTSLWHQHTSDSREHSTRNGVCKLNAVFLIPVLEITTEYFSGNLKFSGPIHNAGTVYDLNSRTFCYQLAKFTHHILLFWCRALSIQIFITDVRAIQRLYYSIIWNCYNLLFIFNPMNQLFNALG